jgi:hypothetical protein
MAANNGNLFSFEPYILNIGTWRNEDHIAVNCSIDPGLNGSSVRWNIDGV